MKLTSNNQLRAEAKQLGVPLWMIAERVGLTDGNFSRHLRRELPEVETKRLIGIVREIAAEQEANNGSKTSS